MNLLLWFVFFFAGTAYSGWNYVEIHNQLGPGIILHYHIRVNRPKQDEGNQKLKFNTSHIFKRKDLDLITLKRSEIHCMLRYDKYYHDVQIYRQAAFKRSGILRSWEARKDGIYFKTRHNRPWEFKFHWNVGK
ncbi:hypothetical protein N665_0286s0034 [Sinapis alba]|nr:hypothetical protein N665_0286s0034 [Sinapis alba]